MEGLRWVQLSNAERDEFLGTGGTGVLSFSTPTDEPPASLPVSYGYAEETGDLYFRLSFPPGSSKTEFVDNPVSFVTHERTDEGWRSVVATGYLEPMDDLPYESATIQGMWAVDIPTVEVFDRPRGEITFQDFCLDPATLTGRKETR